jgi:hypothetical protein
VHDAMLFGAVNSSVSRYSSTTFSITVQSVNNAFLKNVDRKVVGNIETMSLDMRIFIVLSVTSRCV